MVAERRHGIDRLHDISSKVARVRCREAHPANPRNLADGGEQLGEGALAFAILIGINVLPQQLDLSVAGCGQRTGLRQNRS